MILLDCCFSGAFTARHRFQGGVRQEPRRGKRERGTFYLTSSTHMKASKAEDPERPSLFTQVLLDGLRGAAASTSEDGWITTSELSRYAFTEMARLRQHTPVESSEGVTEPIRLVAAPGSEAAVRQGPAVVTTPADDAPFDADQWRRLISYYTSCMQRSTALQAFVDPKDTRRYVAVPPGPEVVYSGEGPVSLSGSAAALADRARDEGRGLLYGYPVVPLRPGRGKPVHLGPLLICDVNVSPDHVLHASFPPRPSPALIDLLQLSEVEADELVQRVEQVFVPGQPASLAAVVSLLMATFDLEPLADLEPAALVGRILPAPIDRVQNAGMLYSVDVADAPERQLIEDVQAMVKNPGAIAATALGRLAAMPAEAEEDPPPVLTVAMSPVNEAQEEVIRSAMSRPMTVAQGPPGTGKSQLVTALLTTATASGQSVLIGSTSNQAVNSVVERVAELIGPGLVLRTGNKEHRQQEPEHLAVILRAYPQDLRRVVPDDRTPQSELRLVANEAEGLRRALNDHRLLERDLADLAIARQPETADVVPLPEENAALEQLVQLTDRALASRWFGWWYRWRLRAFGITDRKDVELLSERAVFELRWRERHKSLSTLPEVQKSWRRLNDLVAVERPNLSLDLLKAQIARRVAAQARLLQDRADEMAKPNPRSWAGFPQLLSALPGWAVTALSARSLQPRAGMYDLVIIDEAAQCTVPAILPMLYRAKRALIIGDPRQLPPVVDLNDQDDAVEQAKAGLGAGWLGDRRLIFGRHSAYDAFAAAVGTTYLLDEHYRCHPEIVDVPNREVYQGRLTVLTDPARLAVQADPAVRWHHVTGRFDYGPRGSGRNDLEIAEVIAEVRRLRSVYPDASIGVVTPLTAQQRNLAAALRRAGLEENLLCATIHKFQGSERDIMVISPVGAHGIHERTKGWLVHQTNLWNVAITRARSELVVVGDRSWWSAQRGLLTALANHDGLTAVAADADPEAADRLHAALRTAGLSVRRDVAVSGRVVDLMVSGQNGGIAVVVDDPLGDPDGRKLRKVLALIDILGAHTQVARIPAWRCYAEPEAVAGELALMI
ncbi:hypothetical protein GCM10010172_04080 [Paractinoplanes ferrugineus]|uniref:AAA domain-containing protein n=1 Tax=Paractinoplanes ferrugineus TaxID=113564 RepID=A0A919J6B9_9ACTN|nr:hypothetical protein Afe05nite_56530 [Actinoplanes ferrugineus]